MIEGKRGVAWRDERLAVNNAACNTWLYRSWRPDLRPHHNAAQKTMNSADEALWHKCQIIFPRRTIEGKWTDLLGQVWRRKIDGKWQYKQDEETESEFDARQW